MHKTSIKTARYPAETVTRLEDISIRSIQRLLNRYGMELRRTQRQRIPGSYWGNEEAGLIGNRLYARANTPVHSILHEGCHYICMPPAVCETLHTNAGGDYDEENGVCYLQILLADHLPDYNSERMLRDMDAWGYTFRLGSAAAWFYEDASDARQWLLDKEIINIDNSPAWRLRQE